MSFNLAILKNAVVSNSYSDDWDNAVKEWDVINCEIDMSKKSKCVCHQEGLKYLFTIQNRITGMSLSPIGSTCIDRFGVDELSENADFIRRMLICAQKGYMGEYISIKDKAIFTREIIDKLFYIGVFNHYESYHVYEEPYEIEKYKELKCAFNGGKYNEQIVRDIIYECVLPYAKSIKRKYSPTTCFSDFEYACKDVSYCYLNDNLVRLTFPIDAVRPGTNNPDYVQVKLPSDFVNLDKSEEELFLYDSFYVTLARFIAPKVSDYNNAKGHYVETLISLPVIDEYGFSRNETVEILIEKQINGVLKDRHFRSFALHDLVDKLKEKGARKAEFTNSDLQVY